MSQAKAGAVSGAASGAAAGAALGPYGAAAGAVLGGISGYMSGSAADDAEKELELQIEYQAALSQVTARAQKADLVASKEQAMHKHVGEMRDLSVAFMKERANAIAGAGEAGIAGGSVDRTVTDKFIQESKAKARGEYTIDAFNQDASRAIAGVQIGLAGQIYQYQGVDNGALMGAALMDVANAGLSIAGEAQDSGGWSKWASGS